MPIIRTYSKLKRSIQMNRHPYCETNPKGWFGHKHTYKTPAMVTLDYDYYLPDGINCIPAGTPHTQWESTNFGWWKWADKHGNTRLAKY